MKSSVVQLFPQISENGKLKKQYRWLKSDYDELVWTVLDPVNPERNTSKSINFDTVLSSGLNFSDRPEIIEDIKLSLVTAIEVSPHMSMYGNAIGSLSKITRHVKEWHRFYREIFDMGLTGLSDIDDLKMDELWSRLMLPEHLSQKWSEKIHDYLKNQEFTDIKVVHYKENKHPSRIDKEFICKEVGIQPNKLRDCHDSKIVFHQYTNIVSELYPEKRFEDIKDFSTDVRQYTGLNSYEDLNATLERIFNQSTVKGLLNFPLEISPNTTVYNENLAKLKVLTADEYSRRTKNIPPKVFLQAMDRCVRWVLDYSEELFALQEKAIKSPFDINDKEDSKYIAGMIRRETQDSLNCNAKGSPFPLSGLSNTSTRETSYESDLIEGIVSSHAQELSPAEIQKQFKLTKNQWNYCKRTFVDGKKGFDRHLPGTGVTLNQALYGYLPLSCAFILLAFTAGRESSIYQAKAGCVDIVNGRLSINLYVPKTLRDYDWFPTVALVKKAVEVMERLSEKSRIQNGNETLFEFKSPINIGDQKKFRFDGVIDSFVDFLGLDMDEEGNHWDFSEHQFRRFFAIMYFYRYDKGDFESLSWHLRHTDWSMTSIYLSEKEFGDIFREVEILKIAESGTEAANDHSNHEPLVEKFREKIDDSLEVNTKSQYEIMAKHAEEDELVIDFLPDGLCFGHSPSLLEKAKCKLEEDGQIVIRTNKASKELCGDCHCHMSNESIKSNKEPNRSSDNMFLCNADTLSAVKSKNGGLITDEQAS